MPVGKEEKKKIYTETFVKLRNPLMLDIGQHPFADIKQNTHQRFTVPQQQFLYMEEVKRFSTVAY